MILKGFFNGKYRSIEEVDCWVVAKIEPFIEDGDCIGRLEVDFDGCFIGPSRLARVFFHTIRNGIKIKCINYTVTQKAMIDFVYKDIEGVLGREALSRMETTDMGDEMRKGVYDINDRGRVEMGEQWRDIIYKIPFIQFKEGWQVKIIPPYAGTVARFKVKDASSDVECSVYLDWFENTGYFGGEPFWEVHTCDYGEFERFELDDTDGVVNCIDYKLKAANLSIKEDLK